MDRLPYLILALQVELGECANEWRGFKFWSENREPRTKTYVNGVDSIEADYIDCFRCMKEFKSHSYACPDCGGLVNGVKIKNPLLEEYVDCLHFVLSLGVVFKHKEFTGWKINAGTVTEQFNDTFRRVTDLNLMLEVQGGQNNCAYFQVYETLLASFLGLGDRLGFTWEEIEQAYLDKNEINHKRQETGY
ncbi:dUTP diphosphatase [Shouchella rhizosphaerae]|uniref:dUTP diphosphatase n=1 Tax=Shouchella rhizosphaerae TaxID=866786 RepID=UPI003F7E74D6